MSDFLKAYNRTMGHEGRYAHNPKDTGGETYCGISRNNWPKWAGWRVIDSIKANMVNMPTYGTSAYDAWVHHFNGMAAISPNLQNLVQAFYKDNFWKRLGEINDQRIAEEVFDKTVNCGNVASFWLQRAASVGADGVIGPLTISTVNSLNPTSLLHDFNEQAKHYYEGIIERDPSQSVFRKSWFSRLKTYDNAPYVA